MVKIIVTLIIVISLAAGCMMPTQTSVRPILTPQESQEQLECLALARQAAQGTGAFFSDPAIRAAFYNQATANFYRQCLANRADIRALNESPAH